MRKSWWVLLLVALLLAACGPRRVVVAPMLAVQELRRVDAEWAVKLRVDSVANVPFELSALRVRVDLDGVSVPLPPQSLALTLPARGTETIDLRVTLPPAAVERLSAARDGRALYYRIDGEIESSKPSVRLLVDSEGRISAVPGVVDQFR